MTAHELISICRNRGITLLPTQEGKLRVSPPPERLPADLVEELKRHKQEILALLTRPYINEQGELIIPFTADPKYHWWAGGQSIALTLQELDAPPDVWRRYVPGYTETQQ
jgi:hypothetical protein